MEFGNVELLHESEHGSRKILAFMKASLGIKIDLKMLSTFSLLSFLSLIFPFGSLRLSSFILKMAL